MSMQERIRQMLHHDPFQPFRVVTSSGESYTIPNPDLVAVMKSEIFIAQPNSDHHSFVPLLQVTAVETVTNGRKPARRKRRG